MAFPERSMVLWLADPFTVELRKTDKKTRSAAAQHLVLTPVMALKQVTGQHDLIQSVQATQLNMTSP